MHVDLLVCKVIRRKPHRPHDEVLGNVERDHSGLEPQLVTENHRLLDALLERHAASTRLEEGEIRPEREPHTLCRQHD